ncbi:DsbA family protein [Sphingomonas lenta]|uniref:Protein-disulfide isomerase n=1 Tax=Sphingomonas lenta TaxID=1141887 RepID=A0A2A2SDG8_9SPHN|nr:thioredoxin domain-containing protein [Sphingomonas lenta]PAX07061.1 protein-disulfide isomerase [Sphingomonas lenta]
MKFRFALASLALVLAGCGEGGAGNSNTQAPPVQAKAAPAGQSWTETVVRTPEGGYRMGNPDAPIKLVEYGARTCPTCGAFSRAAATPLEQQYVASGKVSFEFRDFLVHGAPDLAAALLGQCGGEATFFPILDQMYANQDAYLDRLQQAGPAFQERLNAMAPGQAIAALGEQMGLIDFVQQRGIPESRARACLADTAAQDRLVKLTQEAQAGGTVTGTPTFLLNGEPLQNTVSWQDVEAALKRAGA